LLLLTTLSLLVGGRSALAQSSLRLGAPLELVDAQCSRADISHAQFDALLRKYVDAKGMVCYSEWRVCQHDVAQLRAYLENLSQVDASLSVTREVTMAYYINAYNAMTIWGILHEYPVNSIQRIDGKRTSFAIFDDLKLWDGSQFVSLNEIENDVLRPLGDPRIHFALVCAARGCPRLLNAAFQPETLHWQLDENAREFFSRRDRFHLSCLSGKVHMSPILKWYRDDFGETDQQVISTVFAYLPERDQRRLSEQQSWSLKYLGYDWSLNDRCPTPSIRLAAIPYKAYSKVSPALGVIKKTFSADSE